MADINYKDFDKTGAFERLKKLSAPVLADVLTADRVKSMQAGIDLGNGEALQYNYAAKQVTDDIVDALATLAEEQQLIAKYRELAAGAYMNTGENRRVLHHLTRGQLLSPVVHEGKDLGAFYAEQQQRIADFAEAVHSGTITASDGKPFDTVVQVGIGGSDLGPGPCIWHCSIIYRLPATALPPRAAAAAKRRWRHTSFPM
jgi:glucose-6-phosphate isomerase